MAETSSFVDGSTSSHRFDWGWLSQQLLRAQLRSHRQALTTAQPWFTGVPDSVPEKIERQYHNGAGEPREDHQRPVGNEDIRDRAAHHIAPGRCRRGDTHPQKAQRPLDDNGHAALRRDEPQIGSHTLGGDVLQYDPEMRCPDGRGGINVKEVLSPTGLQPAPP